jgi:type I restriction enzyme M protein
MPVKKSELYSSLWKSCDELRGGMDASQYKDYVLVLLFVKYVSDRYAGQKDALLDVPKGGSFADMVALKGDKEIGDKINKIIGKLAEANNLKGVIDIADFNDDGKSARARRWWTASPISSPSSTTLLSTSAATALSTMTFWATPTNT